MLEPVAVRVIDRLAWQARGATGLSGRVGGLALLALYREAALAPKPGLVSPVDAGSHLDMDYRTFLRSLEALQDYFPECVRLGEAGAPFATLRQLGVEAEAAMGRATGGVNTHRGAIFNLGLLCAAAGAIGNEGAALTPEAVCGAAAGRWAGDLQQFQPLGGSHGAEVARRFGAGGARQEAGRGFPTVLRTGLPAYRQALQATASPDRAAVQSLFALMAQLDDTNLLWRGGLKGLCFAKVRAKEFLLAGGTLQAGWEARAWAIHRAFVARHLSPGGSADLLGATLFLSGL